MTRQNGPLGRRAFLAAGVGTAAVTIGLPGPLEGAEWSDREKANVKVVNDWCAAWQAPLDFKKIGASLSADCVYRGNETAEPMRGREAIIERLRGVLGSAEKAEFEVVQTFAKGPIVVNERFDRFTRPERNINWHGIGVFFMKDGLIAEWQDFTIRD